MIPVSCKNIHDSTRSFVHRVLLMAADDLVPIGRGLVTSWYIGRSTSTQLSKDGEVLLHVLLWEGFQDILS